MTNYVDTLEISARSAVVLDRLGIRSRRDAKKLSGDAIRADRYGGARVEREIAQALERDGITIVPSLAEASRMRKGTACALWLSEKQHEALKLRVQGLGYEGIGKRLGVSRGRAHQLVKVALRRTAPRPRGNRGT